ncbi:MAG: hypothetical protein LPJ91_10605 [Pseudazoarcus pumilus]|nr:hypothetical protein [Pseudazoarcus pumilus]
MVMFNGRSIGYVRRFIEWWNVGCMPLIGREVRAGMAWSGWIEASSDELQFAYQAPCGLKVLEVSMRNKSVLVRLSFFLFAISYAHLSFSQEGPFGLYWGESSAEIKVRGVDLIQTDRDGDFVFYSTNKAPKHFSDAEFYALVVHLKYGLQKVTMVTKDIKGDITGSSGKGRYSEIKLAISQKYGSSEGSFEYSGRRLFDGYDEFYQCLRYDGCGSWVSFWKIDQGGRISLELKGLSRGEGYLMLTYEGPIWEQAVDERNVRKSSSDKDAL